MKVSVLVPIYGVEHYIAQCAESLFLQTYENIEYIFVNDCTKDRSVSVLEEVLERFPQPGDSFRYGDLSVTVLAMDGRRVEKVLVQALLHAEEE